MPESIFIFNPKRSQLLGQRPAEVWQSALFLLALALSSAEVRAEGGGPPQGKEGSAPKIIQPEEDDFSTTPFTEYGEFNEEADEEADAKFFAHGRFFGISLGTGYEGVTGNRGSLYQGGLPMIDFRVYYWFNFNFALSMGGYYAKHYYTTSSALGGHVDVNLIQLGLGVKYYFDTKNFSSALSFANPYLIGGFGAYSQSKSSFTGNSTQPLDTCVGMNFGAGLEFVISPKKAYLQIEGKYHVVTFADSYDTEFSGAPNNVPDLTGGLYTLTANVLFTW